jgi:universal stress protein family protein
LINPLRSEQEAFRFTVIVTVLVAPVVVAAILFDSGVALGVAGGLLLGLVFAMVARRRAEPAEQVTLKASPDSDRHRILVVANETLTGAALRREIEQRARSSNAELRVVCPALNTKVKHWASDEDEARANAGDRLNEIIAALERDGFAAQGDIGDGDPVQAIEDALRQFPADEVIVSTHPPGRSHWLEREVVERARERFPIPVTHVIVDLERDPAT